MRLVQSSQLSIVIRQSAEVLGLRAQSQQGTLEQLVDVHGTFFLPALTLKAGPNAERMRSRSVNQG